MGAVRSLAASEGAELVRRCRAGDGAAWEEIVQSYSRRIYNLAYRFTSRSDAAEDLADHTYHLRAGSSSVQREMERRELGAQVQAGIDKLSADLRTCVILRDIEELSYQEIVDLLRIPEGTVKSRINRGRIELAKILRRMKVVAVSEV